MSIRDDYKAELQERVTKIVRESVGLHEAFATQIAIAVTEMFWRELGGERIYFGKRTGDIIRKVAEYPGGNVTDYCRRHGIGRTTFYRVRDLLAAAREAAL